MIHDTGVLIGRNLRLSLTTRSFFQLVVSPLVFFAGFAIVLDRLLTLRGVDFGQFLPPAIVMMAMGLAPVSTAFFIGRERQSGMLDRCRTMPINSLSVLIARLGTDAVRSLIPSWCWSRRATSSASASPACRPPSASPCWPWPSR